MLAIVCFKLLHFTGASLLSVVLKVFMYLQFLTCIWCSVIWDRTEAGNTNGIHFPCWKCLCCSVHCEVPARKQCMNNQFDWIGRLLLRSGSPQIFQLVREDYGVLSLFYLCNTWQQVMLSLLTVQKLWWQQLLGDIMPQAGAAVPRRCCRNYLVPSTSTGIRTGGHCEKHVMASFSFLQ